MSDRDVFHMAKKTVRPDTPTPSEQTPSRRRTPAAGRRTTTRRAATPNGEAGASTSAISDGAIDRAADVAMAGGIGPRGRTPTSEEIAEAAYRRYLERGGQHGRDFDDWVEAERSLRER
jgi:hypothetical protein